MEKDKNLIKECREAWEALGWFRQGRRRCKDFAYGRQWGDTVVLPSGRIITEGRRMAEAGRTPVTNNLIGRMIKQIVGYYRYMSRQNPCVGGDVSPTLPRTASPLEETDARSLEEFLISGMTVQRVKLVGEGWLPGSKVSSRSPERVFFRRFHSPDASDARFLGMLHDLSPSSLVERFGYGEMTRISSIIESARTAAGSSPLPCLASEVDFGVSDVDGLCRVIEVWRRLYTEVMTVYDIETGNLVAGPATEEASLRVDLLNRRREAEGRHPLAARTAWNEVWEQTWLLPDGTVLDRCLCHRKRPVPFVMRLYPMVDGEVHSMVETVIDQQKFVNRLVGLLDDILAASAKGAVLYPVDQLPEGMTWEELRRLWSSPAAILPFRRTSKSIQPRQISGSGSCAGATDLLKTQLSLFDDISGAGGIISGTGRQATGADMARLQRDGAAIAMLDILSAFREFALRRDSVVDSETIRRSIDRYGSA